MIVLFKEKARGKTEMLKEELIQAAEDSGIAQKPIRGEDLPAPTPPAHACTSDDSRLPVILMLAAK